MTTLGLSRVLVEWLQRPRRIKWSVVMGLDHRRKPAVCGEFTTTLGYLDDQGEKWGDTYVKVVGQHFDDYAHWNAVHSFVPLGGLGTGTIDFVPTPFSWRRLKGAAPGVTGLIGEVLVTVFLQRELNLSRTQIAHLLDNRKAPDLCLDVEPHVFSEFLRRPQCNRTLESRNRLLADALSNSVWSEALPLECKSRREGGHRGVTDALRQLVEYWRAIPDMAGYGIFAQVDVFPETQIKLHMLAPLPREIPNVRKIITGDVAGTRLEPLPQKPTYRDFQSLVGGRLLG